MNKTKQNKKKKKKKENIKIESKLMRDDSLTL